MNRDWEPSAEAEDAFAAYLVARDSGNAPDFETWVADRPALSADLRQLHTLWRRLHALVDQDVATRTATTSEVGRAAFLGDVGEVDAAIVDRITRRIDDVSRLGSTRERYGEPELIGSGGMADVFRIFDTVIDRHVAKKVLRVPPSESGSPPEIGSRLVRFEREARVLGQLDHPGVVAIHDLGVDADGRLFFTMPLVEGTDLTELLDPGRHEDWNTERVLKLIESVCQTVAYAHGRGVIHRDLKPSNVRVGRFGEVFVMDWGLARFLEGDEDLIDTLPVAMTGDRDDSPVVTEPGVALGTAAYMSPEQAAGDRDAVGPPADVYGLGAILYHLLVGHPPYIAPGERPSGRVVHARVAAGPPPAIETERTAAPPELVAICEKAMQRRVEDRYASAQALAADLRAYLENRVVSAHRTGAWVEFRKWVRRNRATAASLAAVVLVAITGLSVMVVQEIRNTEDQRLLVDKERAAKRLATESGAVARARAAQMAMQRGAWREALAEFDLALEAGHPDEAALRLARANAYLAVAEPDLAQAEIDRLRVLPGAEALQGEMLLAQAALIGDGGTPEQTTNMAREALEIGLSPADESYAMGLIAEQASRAEVFFRNAITEEPFHRPAWSALLTILFITGQHDAARTCAGEFAAAFPQESDPVTLEALLATIHGDQAAAEQALSRLRSVSSDVTVDDLATVLEIVRDGLAMMPPEGCIEGADPAQASAHCRIEGTRLQFGLKMASMQGPAMAQALGGGMPGIVSLSGCFQKLIRLQFVKGAEAMRTVTEAIAHAPIPEALFARAQGLGMQPGAGFDEYSAASRAFEEASLRTSMLLPRTRAAEHWSLWYAMKALALHADEDLHARARAILRRLGDRDDLTPYQIEHYTRFAERLDAGDVLWRLTHRG